MSEPVRPTHHLTVEEYLALEETAEVRHEYVGGNVFAMVGATKRHNRVITNILRKLADAADDAGCRVYTEAVKLRVSGDVFYYPDVMIACEPDDDPLVEHNPCLVVEVVSPKTEATDRREKLLAYRNMPSLDAYLIVAQDRRWVEHHFRDESGEWQNEILEMTSIPLACPPDTILAFEDIYRGIDLTQ
ncbi:MAG: Uma2 family endonuclease [Rubrobacteraceae bacterium]